LKTFDKFLWAVLAASALWRFATPPRVIDEPGLSVVIVREVGPLSAGHAEVIGSQLLEDAVDDYAVYLEGQSPVELRHEAAAERIKQHPLPAWGVQGKRFESGPLPGSLDEAINTVEGLR
jgi:hypothetical protein